MIAPTSDRFVTFERCRNGFVAKLGVHAVGVVQPWHVSARCGAVWYCYLPGPFGDDRYQAHSARTVEDARAALEQHILDWIDAGGLASASPPAEPAIRSYRRGASA